MVKLAQWLIRLCVLSNITTTFCRMSRLYSRARVPRVEKDEFEIETCAKHEHIAVKFDLGNGAARQGVTDGDETGVLIAAVERRRVQRALTHFQVTAAVDYLYYSRTE